jgi:hypothetical protein
MAMHAQHEHQARAKCKTWWTITSLTNFRQSTTTKQVYLIMDNISLSYILLEHYFTPFFQKEAI